MTEIISVNDLLALDLNIPPYQRPYKWTIRNIEDLLSDIASALSDSEKYRAGFKYRVGTVIVHQQKETDKLDVVDGQQRIISLVLLKLYLARDFRCSILEKEFTDRVSQANIHANYTYIREWFSLKSVETKKAFLNAFDQILEVVLIGVDQIYEAFQLFDSQNARGRELDPHDLLKAYHLREMQRDPYEMEHAVTKWEAKASAQIKELFDLYLFPILNWARGDKSRTFTAKEIDAYKGISGASSYTYARRTGRAMPCFQITEPFIAGNDFFEMVDHYLLLLRDVKNEIGSNPTFASIKEVLDEKSGSTGFGYVKNLFYCALLCYYDKFHNFDELAVKKLFTWAFMLRVDMKSLGYNSVNKYAIGGEGNTNYTNRIPVFSKIAFARLHTEIYGLNISARRAGDQAKDANWNQLYSKLKEINGIEEASHE